jgi:hypothetical protein
MTIGERMRVLGSLVGLGFAFALGGCAGAPITGTTSVKSPTSEVVRAHRAIAVRAEPAKPDWQTEGKEITAKLAHALEGLGVFTAVIDGGVQAKANDQPDIELVVAITDVTRVTASEREKLGESAGEARLVVDVRLRDMSDRSDAGGASFRASGYVGPRGGTTEDTEDEVVRRIARYVSGAPGP